MSVRIPEREEIDRMARAICEFEERYWNPCDWNLPPDESEARWNETAGRAVLHIQMNAMPEEIRQLIRAKADALFAQARFNTWSQAPWIVKPIVAWLNYEPRLDRWDSNIDGISRAQVQTMKSQAKSVSIAAGVTLSGLCLYGIKKEMETRRR